MYLRTHFLTPQYDQQKLVAWQMDGPSINLGQDMSWGVPWQSQRCESKEKISMISKDIQWEQSPELMVHSVNGSYNGVRFFLVIGPILLWSYELFPKKCHLLFALLLNAFSSDFEVVCHYGRPERFQRTHEHSYNRIIFGDSDFHSVLHAVLYCY